MRIVALIEQWPVAIVTRQLYLKVQAMVTAQNNEDGAFSVYMFQCQLSFFYLFQTM